MLGVTLATEFIPSTNIKGEVAGANWSFLLPSLDLKRILCVGSPSRATLLTLSRLADEVIIWADGWAAQPSNPTDAKQRLVNVRTLAGHEIAMLPGASADLALIASARDTRRLGRDAALIEELRRLLKPEGLLCFEPGGPLDRLRAGAALQRLTKAFGAPQQFWLTPLSGEMHTAVPTNDAATIDYFLQHQLTSRSADLGRLKRAVRALGGKKPSMNARKIAPRGGRKRPSGAKARVKRVARVGLSRVYSQAQRTLDSIEQAITARTRAGQAAWRYGALAGPSAADLAKGPPDYLRVIARADGVDIDNHRWGLMARGEYSSRKVLFFLFNQDDKTPEYIVKMTRDPALNARLENEHYALKLLWEAGLGERETLPRAAFFGHHHGLAIVGETIIDGVPFEQRATGAANCPYARAAIGWLTHLGTITADHTAATPLQIAKGLETLLQRFAQIYQLTPAHQDFLAGQIAAIRSCRDAIPIVFQHGDPGCWNAFVTPSGRIAFLDWEAAESQGIPLWDVLYFVRTYGAWAARDKNVGDVIKGFAPQFLADTPFRRLLIDAANRYCETVGVPGRMVEPFFYTCWMHRALKESTRLPAERLEHGHYINLLRACIEQREALQPLFSIE